MNSASLRIALITSEFVGLAHSGGIGTYMRNLATMLSARGHQVEVFSTGRGGTIEVAENGVLLHTVDCQDRGDFPKKIAPLVLARHQHNAFDVAEGPEFMAETSAVAALVPDLPLVLKLHTPNSLVSQIDRDFIPLSAKARFMVGGLLRGRIVRPWWWYDRERDYEYKNISTATEVSAPCKAIVSRLQKMWSLDERKISIIPNVFIPPPSLLQVSPCTDTKTIGFIGRLELRKGVMTLPDIIPRVLDKVPNARFKIVGRSLLHTGLRRDIAEILRFRLKEYEDQVIWSSGVPHDQALNLFQECDIFLFPSAWENFPNVCLEAMAAARGVVGSMNGGMSEIIEHRKTGLLIRPENPKATADAIVALLKDQDMRVRLGTAARVHVLQSYSKEAIAPLQEGLYRRAISRASVHTEPQRS